MKQFLSFILFSVAFSGCASAGNKNTCNAPELIDISQAYNKLVCEGIDSLNQGDYGSAINAFEKALKQPVYEVPNFKLYPRLALAYSMNGNDKEAKENLEKARLSLEIFTRMLVCVESDNGIFIAKSTWGQANKVKSPYHDEIMGRMCGASYEHMYERQSLEDILIESELVKHYLEIKKKIEGKK